ncbi:MAG TPA: hypothetical protein VM884_07050 [Flavisolibacter sp.]|nr:hypothetical protein [Flavisolibacter sp.]
MKTNIVMRNLFFILTIVAICLSCSKNNITTGEIVEIYLLESYQTITSKCQIDPSLSVLKDKATIKNQDILAYSKTEYRFKLTEAAVQKIKALKDKTPFAVTVDKQVIYYGFFKPSVSSSSCDHSITMDVAWTPGNEIYLRLGYPGQLQGVTIEDKLNDPILIAALRTQGKLQ